MHPSLQKTTASACAAAAVPADSTADTPKTGTSLTTSKVSRGEAIQGPPVFTDKYEERRYLKERLAAAFRIFAKYGFDEGVAGHITLRDPVDPTTFWVNPFGVHFSLITASSLLHVNHAGTILDGSGPVRILNTAAFVIHSAIHQARPDVVAAAHSHSIYGRTFCAFGRELDMITQDSCAFYKDHMVFKSFKGVVLAQEEGKEIASQLGSKKAALLMNHGLLTTGSTIEETVFWFISLEKCCQSQLLADAAVAGRGGETVKIGDEEAGNTWKILSAPGGGWFSGKPLFDVIEKETGGDYKN